MACLPSAHSLDNISNACLVASRLSLACTNGSTACSTADALSPTLSAFSCKASALFLIVFAPSAIAVALSANDVALPLIVADTLSSVVALVSTFIAPCVRVIVADSNPPCTTSIALILSCNSLILPPICSADVLTMFALSCNVSALSFITFAPCSMASAVDASVSIAPPIVSVLSARLSALACTLFAVSTALGSCDAS